MKPARPLLRSIGAAALLAAVYFVTGKLGLLLAIPPGYASAVWPPSGIALAGTLILGYRVLPGVALGSFLVNVSMLFGGGGHGSIGRYVAVAASIALGAALQAAFGAAIVRRFVGFPTALDHERDVAKFLLLAGPIGCVANATWSVMAMLIFGAITPSMIAFTWWTWWVGDTIGALVATPVVLVLGAPPREIWRRRRISLALPLAVAFGIVVLLFVRARQWERERLQLAFQRRAERLVAEIDDRFTHYVEILNAISDFHHVAGTIDRRVFGALTEGSLTRNPDIDALSFNPRVTRAEREAVEAAAQRDGIASFRIWELGGNGDAVPAAPRPEYFPVFYVEPRAGNERALGFDLASEGVRAAALDTARATGKPAATAPIVLVQGHADRAAILLALPIFAPESQGGAPDAAPDRLVAYVTCVFYVVDLFPSSATSLEREGVTIALYDAGPAADAADEAGWQRIDLGGAPAGGARPDDRGLRPALAHVTVGQRAWVARLGPTQRFLEANRGWQAWSVLAGGLFLSGLLGALLLVVTGRALRIQRLVLARTTELAAANDALRERAALLSRREEELSHSLKEKELLLKEVHHRVKNNLQVISSLLSLQAQNVDDARMRALFSASQDRIRSMALVHEQLYHSTDLIRVDLSAYIRLLLDNLVAGQGGDRIQVNVDAGDLGLMVPIDVAIPVGLILNELVSNSLKHAFPDPRSGSIAVRLVGGGPGTIVLTVADDGVGLPPGVVPGKTQTLGLELVVTLVEQLDAQLTVNRGDGTEFRIVFPDGDHRSTPGKGAS